MEVVIAGVMVRAVAKKVSGGESRSSHGAGGLGKVTVVMMAIVAEVAAIILRCSAPRLLLSFLEGPSFLMV